MRFAVAVVRCWRWSGAPVVTDMSETGGATTPTSGATVTTSSTVSTGSSSPVVTTTSPRRAVGSTVAPSASVSSVVTASSVAAATATIPATSGEPGPGCVTGWVSPTRGTALRTDPLDVIREGMGVSGEFAVVEMRYFTGPPAPGLVSDDVFERWYVRAHLADDPTFGARWLVHRWPPGAGIVAAAPFDTTGYQQGNGTASRAWTGVQNQMAPTPWRAFRDGGRAATSTPSSERRATPSCPTRSSAAWTAPETTHQGLTRASTPAGLHHRPDRAGRRTPRLHHFCTVPVWRTETNQTSRACDSIPSPTGDTGH